MSLGDWLQVCHKEYRDEPSRRRLLSLYDDAYQIREEDPQGALHRYQEGKELADRLGEAWWGLLFDKLQLDARMHFLRDYRGVLDPAAACVREVRRPVYDRFPARWAVHDTLIAAHLGIDAEGYREAILEEFEILDREVPPQPGPDRYLLLARERELAMALEQWEQAQAFGLRELDLAHADPHEAQAAHFAAFTYPALCQIAYQRRQWAKLEEYCQEAEPFVRQAGHQVERAEMLVWRAVSDRYRVRRETAARALREAAEKQEAVHAPPRLVYFAARIAFHEVSEQAAEVLRVQDEALASLADRNRLLDECRLRIRRLRTLARLERSLEDDLEHARQSARALRFPEKHLAEIESIERGE